MVALLERPTDLLLIPDLWIYFVGAKTTHRYFLVKIQKPRIVPMVSRKSQYYFLSWETICFNFFPKQIHYNSTQFKEPLCFFQLLASPCVSANKIIPSMFVLIIPLKYIFF